MRRIAILPTLLTLGNAICGFAAIHYASKIVPSMADKEAGDLFWLSAVLIFAAMSFDAIDGSVARLAKTASNFGGQLDSLCDAISFGLAPAFLLLRMCQEWTRPPVKHAVVIVAALYMVCALLRLARFNLENSPDPASHKRFKGLPSPAAAGCLAAIALLRSEIPEHGVWLDESSALFILKACAPIGALVVALLMVSRLPYPHLTKQLARRRRHFSWLVQAVLLIFVIALFVVAVGLGPVLIALFWAYALSAPIRFLLTRRLPKPVTIRTGIDDAMPR